MSKDVYVDTYGRSHVASKVLSSGGQGIVYRTEEPNTLLKLEWDPLTQEIKKDTTNNTKFDEIRILPLLEKTNLTLPQTTLRDVAGYTMKLLDDMKSFEEVFSSEGNEFPDNPWLDDFRESCPDIEKQLKQYISSGGLRKRLNAYMKSACVLAKIHASGLVYCDVSDKNMFVSSDSNKANVWLIDCDNLDYMKNTAKNSGWRTPGFGAPEVYQGKGNTMYSDVYSFAIALFWTLTTKHPFIGAAVEDALNEEDFLDDPEEDFACSRDFAWISDRQDDSNDSDIGLPHRMFISEALTNYFQVTFSKEGRKNRQKRTTMPEWAYILAKELDHTVRCGHCQMDYYGSDHSTCPWCDSENQLIRVKSKKVIDNHHVKQWDFVHEQQNAYVDIPLRLLEGFCCDHMDENAFRLRYVGDEVEIIDMSNQYDFSVISEGHEKLIYGSTKIVAKNGLVIHAVCKKNNLCILLEIGV
ncbi:MAG: hypothetical protein Q4G58_04985 [bacterium]|nr:hypothetical protein [bacterium]